MSDPTPNESDMLDAFLERYWADRRQGQVRALAEYLALFPGMEREIARRFVEIEDQQQQQQIGAPVSAAGLAWQPADAPADSWFGPYRIKRELGRGGQAVVFLGEDTRLQREVAVKVLTGWGPQSRQGVVRFWREAEIASKLNHPGICTVYDTGTKDQLAYLVMRYVPGETLRQRINAARGLGIDDDEAMVSRDFEFDVTALEPGAAEPDAPARPTTEAEIMEAVRIIEKVALSVHAAHEEAIVHRDLKPGNIMITPEGEPVILDFGLARDVESHHTSITHSGQIFGTPAYMSPEQLAAKRIRLDRRSDVYSLGVTLYECLTLHLPFEAPTRQALYQAIMTKPPLDPARFNPTIPRDLRIVLQTALEKDRDRRYLSALDFAEDLRRVRSDEPIQARPPGISQRLRRWVQRNPRLAPFVMGSFLLLAVGLVLALWLLDVTRSERDAKMQALSQVAQLADGRRVRELELRANRLWPATPDRVRGTEGMNAWIRAAEALLDPLPDHQRDLAALRERARPISADQAEIDRQTNRELDAPKAARLASLTMQLVRLESEGDAPLSELREVRRRLATLRDELDRRRTWEFDDPVSTLRHDNLSELVDGLRRLKVTLDGVRERRDFALSATALSVETHRDAWNLVIRDLADVERTPRYGGIALEPIRGLIPLGRDPASGLFEFAHLQSGVSAQRDAETGRLHLEADTGIVLVLIPGGRLVMGAEREPVNPEACCDPLAHGEEGPAHAVILSPFLISKYEMTQRQWLAASDRNPSHYQPGASHGQCKITWRNPVEQVSWEDCERLLRRLELVLPTEAQWEYACRAGTQTPWYTGAEVTSLARHANIADEDARDHFLAAWIPEEGFHDGHEVHAPVGSYAANAFGLHDLHGNVWEWCRDAFALYLFPVRAGDGLRQAPIDSRERVGRGGGFFGPASKARAAARMDLAPGFRNRGLGLRPAMNLP